MFSTGLSLPALKRIDERCQRFESNLLAGERPGLADFLAGVEGAERSALVVELLKVDLDYRRRSGETPAPEDYGPLLRSDGEAVRAAFGLAVHRGGTTVPFAAGDSSEEAITERGEPSAPPGDWPVVPGYEIRGVLGAGGMGIVYRAEQLSLSRPVALKMIQRVGAGASELARFRREAESAARAAHENIVDVFDLGVVQGRPFICMELVEGTNLQELIDEGVPPPDRAARLVETLARAVHAAHQKEVIHRDLKPANILIGFPAGADQPVEAPWWERRYKPKIADFGLAKWEDAPCQTVTGDIFGTPSYMAPEQADGRGKDACSRTDVYALGAILYALLTGRPPFKESTRSATLAGVLRDPPVAPRELRREIPADLEAVCLRCLEKSPARRYQSAEELADDLARFLRGEVTHSRPRRWYQKAAAAVARRPLLGATVCLLVAAAAVAPFAARRFDPQRQRNELKSLLARGKSYTFEGHEKLPGPFRRVMPGGSAPRENATEGCFTIESLGTSLWELTDAPPVPNYRITAEVRHDAAANGPSAVGLYFGYREHRTDQGVWQGAFYSLTFADRGQRAETYRDKQGNPTTRVKFASHLFEERPLGVFVAPGPCGNGISFRPALPLGRPAPWRTLRVEVFANKARGLWLSDAGTREEVNKYDAEKFEQYLSITKKASPKMAGVPGQFLPQAGCGLYVSSGEASFRRIIVEPLDGE